MHSQDEQERLAAHQRRAALYFDGGKLEQALLQTERGLDIDPDDYKLNVMKGAILMRATANNPQVVDQAAQVLERVYDWRSPGYHEPNMLFFYALARQKQGLRDLAESIRADERATRTTDDEEKARLIQNAAALRERSNQRLVQADGLLDHLESNGDLVRLTQKHKLQIARQLGNDDEFETSAKAFLTENAEEIKRVKQQVEKTTVPAYEQQMLRDLRQLQDEDLDVHSLLADFYYDRGNTAAALEHLDHVLAQDPKRTSEYYNRGRVLLEMGRIERAQADFRIFLAMSQLPPTNERMTFAAEALRK